MRRFALIDDRDKRFTWSSIRYDLGKGAICITRDLCSGMIINVVETK